MARGKRSAVQRRHLEALVAVAHAGSVHSAARALGMAQPALSRVLAEAERLLGIVLFERSHLGTRITAQGRSAVGQAEYALRAMEAIPEAAKPAVRPVSLGATPPACTVLSP